MGTEPEHDAGPAGASPYPPIYEETDRGQFHKHVVRLASDLNQLEALVTQGRLNDRVPDVDRLRDAVPSWLPLPGDYQWQWALDRIVDGASAATGLWEWDLRENGIVFTHTALSWDFGQVSEETRRCGPLAAPTMHGLVLQVACATVEQIGAWADALLGEGVDPPILRCTKRPQGGERPDPIPLFYVRLEDVPVGAVENGIAGFVRARGDDWSWPDVRCALQREFGLVHGKPRLGLDRLRARKERERCGESGGAPHRGSEEYRRIEAIGDRGDAAPAREVAGEEKGQPGTRRGGAADGELDVRAALDKPAVRKAPKTRLINGVDFMRLRDALREFGDGQKSIPSSTEEKWRQRTNPEYAIHQDDDTREVWVETGAFAERARRWRDRRRNAK